jgi:hypothetical protein
MQTLEGLANRLKFCEKHGRDYVELFIPGANVWSGQCGECAEDEKLSAEVDRILAERRAEKWERMDKIMLKRAPEIETEIDKAMLEEREERRAEWRDYIEEPIREEATVQIEREMRREILKDLRARELETAER